MIGEGFNWEEIKLTEKTGRRVHEDIFIAKKNDRAFAVQIRPSVLEEAGLKKGDSCKLYTSGKTIFMIKKEKGETLITSDSNYGRFGGRQAAIELKAKSGATEFEVLEAGEGSIVFRAVR